MTVGTSPTLTVAPVAGAVPRTSAQPTVGDVPQDLNLDAQHERDLLVLDRWEAAVEEEAGRAHG